MLQVLWERGWLYKYKLDDYTIRDKKDKRGTVIQETSTIHLMDQCRDFLKEDKKLQYIGRKSGATVDRNPKCHP